MDKTLLYLLAAAIPTYAQIFDAPIYLAAATISTPAPFPITTTSPPPTISTSTSTCSTTRCDDYTNACGAWYGGCYAACPGLSTPTFTPPPCPPPTTTPAPAPPTHPIILDSGLPTPCTNLTICIDYINPCSLKYGGCFNACPGIPRPTYTDPGCVGVQDINNIANANINNGRRTFTKLPITTRTQSCGTKCDEYVDACGNTFGPGCYESCTGRPVDVPTYTRPYCETLIATTTTATEIEEVLTMA